MPHPIKCHFHWLKVILNSTLINMVNICISIWPSNKVSNGISICWCTYLHPPCRVTKWNLGKVVCEWLRALPSAGTYMVQVSPESSRAMLSKNPGRYQNSALHTWLHYECDRGCPYLFIPHLLQATCLTMGKQPPSHDRWYLNGRKYVCHVGSCPWAFFSCKYARAWYNIGWLFYWKVSL